jgi:hypothetical protein
LKQFSLRCKNQHKKAVAGQSERTSRNGAGSLPGITVCIQKTILPGSKHKKAILPLLSNNLFDSPKKQTQNKII